MATPTLIALYFIIWWISLFAVLPIGVRNAQEEGEDLPAGSDPGSPVRPMLLKKALITSVVAIPVTAGVAWLIQFID
jgi:predicted secreted protein